MASITLAPLSGRYLSFVEREEIAVLHARRCGVREIARRLDRSPSTISRELRRKAATRGGNLEYRATTAQWHADRRARRPKVSKLAANDALRQYVQDRLGGMIATPDGTAVAGPDVRWIGRRHGRRQDRRWAASWSPEQMGDRHRPRSAHPNILPAGSARNRMGAKPRRRVIMRWLGARLPDIGRSGAD